MQDFYRKKINNTTILFEKRKLPIVSIINAMKFGSAYEPFRYKGIAHFLEHMVFKGTSKRTQEQIANEIEKKGGILNAFTAEEITAFLTKMPSKHFSLGFDILTDLTTNPLFNEREMEKEKKVVLEEIRLKHDTPGAYVLMKSKELLYKKPFGFSALGTANIIKGIKRKELCSFFRNNYNLSNSIISIVGNADISAISNFLKVNKSKSSSKEQALVKINKSKIERRKDLHQAHLTISFHVPSLRDKNRYAVEAFNSILGEGMSSRLFQEIREKRGLAYAVKSLYEQGTNYGYFIVYVGTKKENLKNVKDLILKEIKKMSSIEKKEFEEVKEQLIGERIIESEDSNATALQLIEEEMAGNAEEFYKYEERINSLKIENIKQLSRIKAYSFAALTP